MIGILFDLLTYYYESGDGDEYEREGHDPPEPPFGVVTGFVTQISTHLILACLTCGFPAISCMGTTTSAPHFLFRLRRNADADQPPSLLRRDSVSGVTTRTTRKTTRDVVFRHGVEGRDCSVECRRRRDRRRGGGTRTTTSIRRDGTPKDGRSDPPPPPSPTPSYSRTHGLALT